MKRAIITSNNSPKILMLGIITKIIILLSIDHSRLQIMIEMIRLILKLNIKKHLIWHLLEGTQLY